MVVHLWCNEKLIWVPWLLQLKAQYQLYRHRTKIQYNWLWIMDHDKLFLVAIVFKQLRITTVFSSMQNYSYHYTVLTDQNVCGAKSLHILCYLSDWCDGMAFPKMFSRNFAFQPIHKKFAPQKVHATRYLFGVLPTILYHNVHSTNEQTRMYSVTAPQAYN